MNSNPYLILTRVRNAVILELREIFAPRHNTAVPNFEFNYIETAATGTITFYGNPSSGDTLIIGTNTITFGVDVIIGLTQQVTLANLVAYINANSSTLLVGATTNSIPNQLKLTAVTTGVFGNSIILTTTSKVFKVSASTLTQGGLFDFDNSQIFISDAVPQDFQSWPCIVVNTASASETRYLGPEDSFQAKDVNNIVTQDEIFTSLVVNVDIKVYVIDDTLARDKIIDLIYNNMSEIRHQLAINGIEMIDRTLPNETRIAQNQRIYIENHFILRVYCEWSDSTTIQNVTGVSVSVPVYTATTPIINSPLSFDWSTTNPSPFSYQITAINNPTSYSAVGLPTGLIIDASNGLITGTPAATGTSYVLLGAINASGTGTQSLTITIS